MDVIESILKFRALNSYLSHDFRGKIALIVSHSRSLKEFNAKHNTDKVDQSIEKLNKISEEALNAFDTRIAEYKLAIPIVWMYSKKFSDSQCQSDVFYGDKVIQFFNNIEDIEKAKDSFSPTVLVVDSRSCSSVNDTLINLGSFTWKIVLIEDSSETKSSIEDILKIEQQIDTKNALEDSTWNHFIDLIDI